MKKVGLLLLFFSLFSVVFAQKAPKWLEKQRKAIISITTYSSDNTQKGKGTAFFVSDNGYALSTYALFEGVASATATDTDGNTYPVTYIVGADDMYDVIKIKVAVPKKVPFLTVASDPVANNSPAYLVPYVAGKTGTFKQGEISEVTKLKENYSYYKVNIPIEETNVDAPLLTEEGNVFGISQEDASGKKEHIYAVSAQFANSLQVTSVTMLNRVYSAIGIPKSWPSELDEAILSLYLYRSTQDAKAFLVTLNDFIAVFPSEPDGYRSRASHLLYNRVELVTPAETEEALLKKVTDDMNTALKLSKDKGEGYYNNAQLIYNIAVTENPPAGDSWSLEAAMAMLQQAKGVNDQILFRQLEGDINYALRNYEEAYNNYMEICNSDKASSASYYFAAKAKESIPGANIFEVVTLITKAVEMDKDNPTNETVAYLLEGIDYKRQLMMYDAVIADYDLYYEMLGGQVGSNFYYLRSQAKSRNSDNEGALADMRSAISIDARVPDYLAEEAAILIRMEDYTNALSSLQKAIDIVPDFASCYRLMGICHVRQDNKNEACDAFGKAKELGDPVVDRLISEHCAN